MLKDFKEFAIRGNVIDLAIAVIIGAAFGAIVSSLINDVLTPALGLALGHVDFKDLFYSLNGQTYASLTAAKAAGAPVIAYGQFINTITNFLVIAFVVFLIVKQVNRLKAPAPAAPLTKECPYCASNIPVKAVRCPHCISDLTGRQ